MDPGALAAAVEEAIAEPCDFRTRLLIRDSVRALQVQWEPEHTTRWLQGLRAQTQLASTLKSVADVPPDEGFPSLRSRIVKPNKPEDVVVFFREVSTLTTEPTELYIGGSIALVLSGFLSRHTEDIDLVDEIPASLGKHAAALDGLASRHGLRLAQFQSDYLPTSWRHRVRSIGVYGSIHAFALSPEDVFLSKLLSSRERDRDDLRQLIPHLERERLVELLRADAGSLLGEVKLKEWAEKNWFILYGEPLPIA